MHSDASRHFYQSIWDMGLTSDLSAKDLRVYNSIRDLSFEQGLKVIKVVRAYVRVCVTVV